jgi:hypothetical protein
MKPLEVCAAVGTPTHQHALEPSIMCDTLGNKE